jgi:uncharacterized protein (DUF4213/DUF364 family)
MNSILSDLLFSIQSDAPVRSVLVGVHWTVVCSQVCGLASTLMSSHAHGEGNIKDVGNLHLKSARELSELALADNLLEASLGVAALNSLLEMDDRPASLRNAVDVLIERGSAQRVALVGHFPFIPRLRQAAGQLWVIEQNPGQGEFPAEAAADLLPRADVVAITSSALINHSLDRLLAIAAPGALVMLLGPSTPLSPLLFDHGISILAGARVVDEEAALRTIAQGGSFQQVQGVKLVTYFREEDR